MSELPVPCTDQLELASVLQATETIEAALAPQRDILERAMLGHEALRATLDDDKSQRRSSAESDVQFLNNFISAVLPGTVTASHKVYDTGGFPIRVDSIHFQPKNLYEANMLQAHAIWGNFPISLGGPETLPTRKIISPAVILGALAVDSDVRLLLGLPSRQTATYPIRAGGGYNTDRIIPGKQISGIATGIMSGSRFKELEEEIKTRKYRFIKQASSDQELPSELIETVNNKLSHDNIDALKVGTFGLGKTIRLRQIAAVNSETISSGDLTLERFDYAKRLLDLAIDFDKVEIFKTIIAKRLTSDQQNHPSPPA